MSHHQAAARHPRPAESPTSLPTPHRDATELRDVGATSTRAAKPSTALRKLWVAHVFWIRRFELAAKARDLSQRRVAELGVAGNADAFAKTITPLYGKRAAAQVRQLLLDHLAAVRDFNLARIAGSELGEDQARHDLIANVRTIAAILGKVNPYFPEDAMLGFLSAHDTGHASHMEQVAAADRRFAHRGESHRQGGLDGTQTMGSPAPTSRQPVDLALKYAAKSFVASNPRAGTHARPNEDTATVALDEVSDPGWVIVAGMAVFFAVAAGMIAMS